MPGLGLLLRILLIILIVRALWKLVSGALEGAGVGRSFSQPRSKGGALVRDPICGTYILPDKALTAGRGDDTRYFCSENCRRQWGHGA